MELTDNEIKVLSGISFNSRDIEKGELTDAELALLKEMRAVEQYLSEKYYGHTFRITGCEPKPGTVRDYDEWYYVAPGVQQESAFIARAYTDADKTEVKDDFYRVLVRDEIQQKIQATLRAENIPCVEVIAGFWNYLGLEYGCSYSPMDVLTGRIDAGNDIKVFVDGSALDHGSYESNVVEIKAGLEKEHVAGSVYVVVLQNATADKTMGRVYSESFELSH